jgi:threonine/homoserine/homoserine lactone efflux protein
VFPVVALAIDAVWAFAAGTLSQWLSRSPRRMAAVGGVGGLVMIGLGVSVAATGRRN